MGEEEKKRRKASSCVANTLEPSSSQKGHPAGKGEALIFLFSPLIHFSRKREGENRSFPFSLRAYVCVILAIRLGEKSVGSFSHTRKNILRTPFLFLYQLLYSEV